MGAKLRAFRYLAGNDKSLRAGRGLARRWQVANWRARSCEWNTMLERLKKGERPGRGSQNNDWGPGGGNDDNDRHCIPC